MSCKVLSPLGSCGALLYGGPQSSVNNGILIPDGVPTLDNIVGQPHAVDDRLVMAPIVLTGQMSC